MDRSPLFTSDFWRHCRFLFAWGILFPWGLLKGIDSLQGRIVIVLLLAGVVGTGVGTAITAFFGGLSWWVPGAIFLVLFLYGLAEASYEVKQEKDALEKRLEEPQKRKAIRDLLGAAREKGESLKQGRWYSLESQNQDLENIEIGDEHQTRYDEEVRAWVDCTYNLINDAFSKDEAQHFISNEGYTDKELFGRELPSFMHLSSTQRKYLIPARLKRLDELRARLHPLDVNPDFDPQDWIGKQ